MIKAFKSVIRILAEELSHKVYQKHVLIQDYLGDSLNGRIMETKSKTVRSM